MMDTRLRLDHNAAIALTSALERYLEGDGMAPGDEDEPTLEAILADLRKAGA